VAVLRNRFSREIPDFTVSSTIFFEITLKNRKEFSNYGTGETDFSATRTSNIVKTKNLKCFLNLQKEWEIGVMWLLWRSFLSFADNSTFIKYCFSTLREALTRMQTKNTKE
jgi:hypothetical protein